MKEIILKQAQISDYDTYYKLRAEDANIYWSGFNSAPDYSNFKCWYVDRLAEENRKIYLAFFDNLCIGYVNLDFFDKEVAIGYGVAEEFSSKGLATEIVSQSVEMLKKNSKKNLDLQLVYAWISEKNIPSIRVIVKNGFIKTQQTKIRSLRYKEQKFCKFCLVI